uniref:SET domain-containing protein n=1 Tax=Chaetoceros debilis TaxID=122233 RepID=A0A7S3V8J6_9STRA
MRNGVNVDGKISSDEIKNTSLAIISPRSRSQSRGWSLFLPNRAILLTLTAFLALLGEYGMSDAANVANMTSQDGKVGYEVDTCEDMNEDGLNYERLKRRFSYLEPDIATGSEVFDSREDWNNEDEDEDEESDAFYDYQYDEDEDELQHRLLYPSDGDCFNSDHELCTRSDFFDAYDCDTVLSQPRPIHNESTWMLLRGAYIASVGAENASIQYPASTKSGYQVAVIVQETKMAGRGVYAAEDIAKGTRIWTSRVQSAHFKTGQSYRHFLNSMGNDLVCDL